MLLLELALLLGARFAHSQCVLVVIVLVKHVKTGLLVFVTGEVVLPDVAIPHQFLTRLFLVTCLVFLFFHGGELPRLRPGPFEGALDNRLLDCGAVQYLALFGVESLCDRRTDQLVVALHILLAFRRLLGLGRHGSL